MAAQANTQNLHVDYLGVANGRVICRRCLVRIRRISVRNSSNFERTQGLAVRSLHAHYLGIALRMPCRQPTYSSKAKRAQQTCPAGVLKAQHNRGAGNYRSDAYQCSGFARTDGSNYSCGNSSDFGGARDYSSRIGHQCSAKSNNTTEQGERLKRGRAAGRRRFCRCFRPKRRRELGGCRPQKVSALSLLAPAAYISQGALTCFNIQPHRIAGRGSSSDSCGPPPGFVQLEGIIVVPNGLGDLERCPYRTCVVSQLCCS